MVFIYSVISFSHKKMKFCHFQVSIWNWRASSEVKVPRLGRPKTTCFLSCMEYRDTKPAILLKTCQTKGRAHTRGRGLKKLRM
jgi:hypothetical protein